MRDILLVLATLAGIGVSLVYPFAGLLLWTWFSLMSPQSETYGFAQSLPLNLLVAVSALAGLLLSREPKSPPNDGLIWLSFVFLFWCTLNTLVAVDPSWSWLYWDRTWKIFALGLMVAIQVRNRVRVHALLWVIVISLFYYGVKGGLFTILSGGGSHVYGPQGTIIGDNNQLALALLMTLPLANYLRWQSARRWVRWLLLLTMGFTVVAILGTYSRGGFIGLAALLCFALLRSKNKFAYVVGVGVIVVPALMLMPDSFYARLNSINGYASDSSFQGRVAAWHVAFDYARDHFPFGAGFYGPQLAEVFRTYIAQGPLRAAHSIYFQVLGEQGFVGLGLYLAILAVSFLKIRRLRRQVRGQADLKWASELASMVWLSLLVFCLSGAALSMAYYDLFIVLLGLLLALQGQLVPGTQPFRLQSRFGLRLAAEQ